MNRLITDQKQLSAWARGQHGEMDLAVAFWGSGAIEALGLRKHQDFRILLDLEAGGTNPNVVRDLQLLSKQRVRQVHRLHAKAYIGRNSVVISSANASTNGLGVEGFESQHWAELSLLTDDRQTVAEAKRWFEQLWSASKPITASDIASAEERWKRMRKALPPSGPKDRLILDVARHSPHELEGREIYVCVTADAMSPQAERELDRASRDAGRQLFAYEDWPGIPIDATLIAFDAIDHPRITWDTPRVQRTPAVKKRSRLKFVTPVELQGYSLGPKSEWTKRIRYYRDHPVLSKKWKSEKGLCEPIQKFVDDTNAADTERMTD